MKDKMTLDDLMETVRTGSARPLHLFEQEAPKRLPTEEEEEKTAPDSAASGDAPTTEPTATPPAAEPAATPEGGEEAEDAGDDEEEPAAGDEEEGSEIVAALNAQQNHELENWYKYYKASAWLDDRGFPGMAEWCMKQAKGELEHGEKIFHYLLDRNQPVVLADIKVAEADWGAPLDVFKFAHQTEMETTDRLERLHQMADDQHDRQTMAFLDWFLQEQVEEEAVTLLMVQRLERVGDDGPGLNQLDYELAEELKGGVAGVRESVVDEAISVTANNNFTRLDLGKATFWFSYKTCIAFDTPSTGLVASENAWSATTGKHINQVQPDKSKRLPRKEFEEQLERVISGVGLSEGLNEETKSPLAKRLPGAYDTVLTWLRDKTVEHDGEISLDDLKRDLAKDRAVRGLKWEALLAEIEWGIAHQNVYPLTIEWGEGKKSIINYAVKR